MVGCHLADDIWSRERSAVRHQRGARQQQRGRQATFVGWNAARQSSSPASDKECLLAICQARLHHQEAAAKNLQAAREADPKCALLERAEKELVGATPTLFAS